MGECKMIDGIGGAFLFSNNPKKLAGWYRECLGMDLAGEDNDGNSIYKIFEYRDVETPEIKRSLAWAIIETPDDIDGKPRTGQINYRVKNLAETLSHLKSKGVAVEKSEEHQYGKFAWVKDPEGNQIELWEPSKSE
jgi:predicted enzyme related to lactoylglutathione lyase